MGQTKAKLNAPHVMYNAMYNVTQQFKIRKNRCQNKNLEKKLLGAVSRFSTGKSFKI